MFARSVLKILPSFLSGMIWVGFSALAKTLINYIYFFSLSFTMLCCSLPYSSTFICSSLLALLAINKPTQNLLHTKRDNFVTVSLKKAAMFRQQCPKIKIELTPYSITVEERCQLNLSIRNSKLDHLEDQPPSKRRTSRRAKTVHFITDEEKQAAGQSICKNHNPKQTRYG
jgi:hypothetical protein